MNDTLRFGLNSLKGVKQYCDIHLPDPANTVAAAAVSGVNSAITRVETLDANRIHGSKTSHGASQEKQHLRRILRSQVSDLSRIAKTLDKTAYPDIAAQLKIGHPASYAALLTLALNAVAVVTPIKQVFIAHGAPTTVIEDLQAAIAALQAAINRRLSGRSKRIGSNAELLAALRTGRAHVAVLDAIISIAYKNSPGLLAEWKSAKRVQRRRTSERTGPPTPVAPVSSPSDTPPHERQPSSERRHELLRLAVSAESAPTRQKPSQRARSMDSDGSELSLQPSLPGTAVCPRFDDPMASKSGTPRRGVLPG